MTEDEKAGPCFHCGAQCTDDSYCHGCKAFICDGCERSNMMGFDHEPSAHLEEPPDDE